MSTKYDRLVEANTDFRKPGTNGREYQPQPYTNSPDIILPPYINGVPNKYPPIPRTMVRTAVIEKPPTYIWVSIFSFVFCCWIFGIVAIVKSMQVSNHWANANIEGAMKESEKARKWNMASFIIGILFYLLLGTATIMIGLVGDAYDLF